MGYIYLKQDNFATAIALDILGTITNKIMSNRPKKTATISSDNYNIDPHQCLRTVGEFVQNGIANKLVVILKDGTRLENLHRLRSMNSTIESSVFNSKIYFPTEHPISSKIIKDPTTVKNVVIEVNQANLELWLDSKLNDLKEGRVHDSVPNYKKQLKSVLNAVFVHSKTNTFTNISLKSPSSIDQICFPLIAYKLYKENMISIHNVHYQSLGEGYDIVIQTTLRSPIKVSYEKGELIFNDFIKLKFKKSPKIMLDNLFENPTKRVVHEVLQKVEDFAKQEASDRKWQQVAIRINERLMNHYPTLGNFLDTSTIFSTRINPIYLN